MILDNLDRIRHIDKSGMLDILNTFPDQIEEGLCIGDTVAAIRGDVTKVIIVGVGGSAFTGDVIQAYGKKNSCVPIVVNRDYSLPDYIDSKTLVMVLSYSGNSEEALTAFSDSVKKTRNIFAISSGGCLEELSKKAYCYVKVPNDLQPRAAVAYLLIPSLMFLHKSDLIRISDISLKETLHCVRLLNEAINKETPTEYNLAKQLAEKLNGVTPKIYGYDFLAPIARRWRTQMNENSKIFAFNDEVPECNHNEIESWHHKNMFHYIFLRSPDEIHPIQVRYNFMKEKIVNYTELWAKGTDPLTQMMYLMHLGDYVSVYHAVLQGVDPSPVQLIETLKKYLYRLGSSR